MESGELRLEHLQKGVEIMRPVPAGGVLTLEGTSNESSPDRPIQSRSKTLVLVLRCLSFLSRTQARQLGQPGFSEVLTEQGEHQTAPPPTSQACKSPSSARKHKGSSVVADEPAPQGPALLAIELICSSMARVPTHRAWPHEQFLSLPLLTSELLFWLGKLGLGSEGGCVKGYFCEDHYAWPGCDDLPQAFTS